MFSKFWIWALIFLFILVFVAVFLYFRQERSVLKTGVMQYQRMLEEKDKKIQELQSELELLKKEQVLMETRIKSYKKARSEIVAPKTDTELIERFKNLGYEVKIK